MATTVYGHPDISDDTSPTLGGTLDTNSQTITGDLLATTATGYGVLDEAATGTNPTLAPNRADPDTGIGWTAADHFNLIAGAQNCVGIAENASAPEVGFYGTTPVAQQTGVAVTAAAIHAALVSLGLITA